MEPKDTLSSCSDSEQDMQQMIKRTKILKGSCLNGLGAVKLNFTQKHVQGITKSEFERAFSHIFGEDVDTLTRTFSQNMDTLEQQLTKETSIEYNCQNAFRVLKIQFEKIFTSVLIKPSSLDGTRIEYGFKRAFATLFLQDVEIFTGTMFLNVDQLEKQLDKEEFQEIGPVAAFRIPETQFQKFIKPPISLNDEDGNDAHANDVDEEPMDEVQLIADHNVFATGQQHTEQPKFNNIGVVDQNAEQMS
nr:hypothetical protein [Tanacetum cinerariifolium]